MRQMLCLIFLALLTGGCGFSQRPAWVIVGERRLDSFKINILSDPQGSGAESSFKKAIDEIKKSGDLDLLEKAWLTRMALQTALLKDMDDVDYRELADAAPVPENENFFRFLKGDASAVDVKLLPGQYRGFLNAMLEGDFNETGPAIASMEGQPVSRLIAAGIAIRRDIVTEAIIQEAIDTASANGWKAALIAWLERMSTFYETKGERGKAADLKKRIYLIQK